MPGFLTKIRNSVIFDKTYTLLVLSLAFFLSAWPFLIPKLIVIWLVFWLIEGDFRNKFNILRSNPLFYIIVGFYLLNVASLFYSANVKRAMFDMEVKASLIIFPFLFSSLKFKNSLFQKQILYSFITGVFFAVCFCLIRALFRTLTIDYATFMELYGWGTPARHLFYYIELSYFFHPAYFSMYILLAIVCFYELKPWRDKGKYAVAVIYFIFTSICLTMIYLLSSKAGLLALLGLFFSLSIFYIAKTRNFKAFFLFLFVGIIISVLIFLFNPRIQYALKEIKLKHNNNLISDTLKTDSIAPRIVAENRNDRLSIWYYSLEAVNKNIFFGTGSGDIKDELLTVYKRHNLVNEAQKKLNAHNQFLETAIGQGILGLSVLLVLFLWPLIISVRKRKLLGMSFIAITGISFIFESMLNTQAGVVFFAFFYAFFFLVAEVAEE
jgi:O-antigen ligase